MLPFNGEINPKWWGAGVILCVTIRLDANPVAGLGSLRKWRRRLRRSAAVPYFSLWFAGRRQWICLVVLLLTADNIQKLVLRMHLFVTDMCAHSHNIFSFLRQIPLLFFLSIFFFLTYLFLRSIVLSYFSFLFLVFYLFLQEILSFVCLFIPCLLYSLFFWLLCYYDDDDYFCCFSFFGEKKRRKRNEFEK